MSRATEGRWGSGGVRIEDVTFTSNEGVATHVFHTGEPVRVRMKVHAERQIEDFVFGIGVFNAEGICIYGTNTDIEEFESASLAGDAEVTLVIEAMDLVEGTYKLDVAVHRRDGAPYDYHRLLYTFRVKSRLKDVGIYRPRHHWMFDGGVKFKNRISDYRHDSLIRSCVMANAASAPSAAAITTHCTSRDASPATYRPGTSVLSWRPV